MAHFVAFFISFQKIIPSKIPPGGGTGVIGGSRTNVNQAPSIALFYRSNTDFYSETKTRTLEKFLDMNYLPT